MPVRKMPQNIEAEMSVLGVAFLNKNALVKICEELYLQNRRRNTYGNKLVSRAYEKDSKGN